MRTIVALAAAFPLLAAAQSTTTTPAAPPSAEDWEQIPPPEPAPPAAAPPAEPAPPPQAAPAPAPQAAPPAQAAPPPQAAPPAQPAEAAPPPQPPPPQAAPPAPPRQYFPPSARPPKSRDDWYIGFGIGGGDGLIKTENGSTFTFRETNGGRGTATVFANFKVGGTLSPKFLVGLDISVIDASSDEGGVSSSLSISNVDAMLTWFPWERGVFLRGGGGLSAAAWSFEDPTVTTDGDASGFNVTGGVGYAFWLGKQFNLTLNLDLSRQWYSASERLPMTDGQWWSLWMGFDWY